MNDGKGRTALARRLYHHVVHEGPLIYPKEDLSSMVKGMEEKDQQITDLQDAQRFLLEALETVIRDKAPSYHDCVDDGLPDCAWCTAMNAITRVYGEELNDE